MYIDEYSNPFSVKSMMEDAKEFCRHSRKTVMHDQDEKQKYEYEKMRSEMKENMKKGDINIDDFADNLFAMFNIMNNIADNIDPDFSKKINEKYRINVTKSDKSKQEYFKYKKMFKDASDLVEKQKKQINTLLKEKEDFIKKTEEKKKMYAEAMNALSLQIKELSEKADKTNSLQEEVFNKERAELIQENCKLKNKLDKLQSEYDSLKSKHVDIIHDLVKLVNMNKEF